MFSENQLKFTGTSSEYSSQDYLLITHQGRDIKPVTVDVMFKQLNAREDIFMSSVHRKHLLFIGLIILLLVLVLPFSAMAEEKIVNESKFSLRLGPAYSPFLSGDAGEGQGAPDFDDLFDNGYGVMLEAAYRLYPNFSLIAGIGYEKYNGDTQEGLKFEDLEAVPMYMGCRLHILPGYPVKPYIQAQAGIMHLSSVDVSWESLSSTYWDSSWVFMGAAGIGFDYRIGAWDIYVGLDLRYTGAPDNNLDAADADGFWTLPINLGISYSF